MEDKVNEQNWKYKLINTENYEVHQKISQPCIGCMGKIWSLDSW